MTNDIIQRRDKFLSQLMKEGFPKPEEECHISRATQEMRIEAALFAIGEILQEGI